MMMVMIGMKNCEEEEMMKMTIPMPSQKNHPDYKFKEKTSHIGFIHVTQYILF
ncbi:hypothetical protein HanLR1_Chr13g0466061 [Helianthus annuus]|nr:hypothetical protein HanHA89_Chr13g0495581 [Helianthus annuus]KAJ0662137.1 hypothetical protein HanLR1_Chr13g0466061 [Helianthus annuus]